MAEITREDPQGGPSVPPQGKRLAVVADDDAAIRQLVALHLRRLGWAVLEAADGDQALRLVLEREPDLLVVGDATMPGLSGYEVTSEVRRQVGTHLPVVLMRGSVLSADIAEAYEAGADAYLKKPFTSAELREQVQALFPGD
jgi:two-component system response regulator ResD